MKFVIAGNTHQANEWIQKDIKRREILREVISMKDYRIVHDVSSIRGFQDPHGVFVGTWKQRVDILQIVETLMMQSVYVNKLLGKVYSEVKATTKPKPTPKLTPMGYKIEDAADLLAREIDAEVLRSLTNNINGGLLINVYINGIMQSPDDYTVQNNVLTVTNPDDYDSDLTVHKLDGAPMYHQVILKPRATISLAL